MLNSKDIQTKLSADRSRAARLASDERTDDVKLADLYQMAFARSPSPTETTIFKDYLAHHLSRVKDGKDAAETASLKAKARREVWEDTVWAMLNSKEFLFNH